jgi:hypothetical protein
VLRHPTVDGHEVCCSSTPVEDPVRVHLQTPHNIEHQSFTNTEYTLNTEHLTVFWLATRQRCDSRATLNSSATPHPLWHHLYTTHRFLRGWGVEGVEFDEGFASRQKIKGTNFSCLTLIKSYSSYCGCNLSPTLTSLFMFQPSVFSCI